MSFGRKIKIHKRALTALDSAGTAVLLLGQVGKRLNSADGGLHEIRQVCLFVLGAQSLSDQLQKSVLYLDEVVTQHLMFDIDTLFANKST